MCRAFLADATCRPATPSFILLFTLYIFHNLLTFRCFSPSLLITPVLFSSVGHRRFSHKDGLTHIRPAPRPWPCNNCAAVIGSANGTVSTLNAEPHRYSNDSHSGTTNRPQKLRNACAQKKISLNDSAISPLALAARAHLLLSSSPGRRSFSLRPPNVPH